MSDQPPRAPGQKTTSGADELETIAADWIARRNGGGLSAADERRLRVWLAADPAHMRAWREMESAWAVLQEPRRQGLAPAVASRLEGRERRRRQLAFGWAGVGLAAAAAVLLFATRWPAREQAATETIASSIAVRPDRRLLADGSTVELNAGAEIAVEFAATRRDVRLLRGEALFSIKRDAARPFVVHAGSVEVRAVGTAFSVRHGGRQVDVLVTEGRVAVERVGDAAASPGGGAPEPAPPVLVGVGGVVEIPLDLPPTAPLQPREVSPAALTAALAWRDKRIEFTDTPLAEAIGLFNRHNPGKLEVADAAVAQRRVTGIFWADDPEGFVRLLETGFGIRAERSGETVRLRRQ